MISPVRDVERVLKVALPRLSVRGQTILDAVRLAGGTIGSTAMVARRLGLANRFALARMMQREGLPGLRELAAWVGLLGWVAVAERSGMPLFAIAVRSHKSPAVCYRTVRRLTGLTWMQLRERGWEWLLGRFLRRCRVVQSG
ncbi:MAG: hypothetical protein ACREA0_05095 [bacterium]